jgi:Na+-translocating ferredoxin:NAD+ oxidoreductase subunit B
MQHAVLTAVVALAALAFFSSVLLALVARAFAVPGNPKVEEIEASLPGVNCGGCALPGCAELALRVAEGKADIDACPVGGERVAEMIALTVGKQFSKGTVRRVAVILCNGSDQVTGRRFHYNGVKDCASAALLFGGDKECQYGCMGLGTCAGVCPFDAIHMLTNGLPRVDPLRCTACNTCVAACPKRIIKLVPVDKVLHILCSSHDNGARVGKMCLVGCIACGKCVKAAPEGAIAIEDDLAIVNYDFDIPDSVASVCPTNTIHLMFLEGLGDEIEVEAATGADV